MIVYEDTDEVEESVWTVSPPEVHGSVMEDQNLLSTAEPNVLVEEGELLTTCFSILRAKTAPSVNHRIPLVPVRSK